VGSGSFSNTPLLWDSLHTLNIGRVGSGIGDEYFNGLIDEVLVYNRALIASDVLSLYNNPWQLFKDQARILKAGSSSITGTIAQTLSSFISAITGTTTIVGTSANTLGTFNSSITSTTTITGTISNILGGFISSFIGSPIISGTISTILNSFVSVITSTTTIIGTIGNTLGEFISDMTNIVGGVVRRFLAMMGVGS
jgi:hypothetical protein